MKNSSCCWNKVEGHLVVRVICCQWLHVSLTELSVSQTLQSSFFWSVVILFISGTKVECGKSSNVQEPSRNSVTCYCSSPMVDKLILLMTGSSSSLFISVSHWLTALAFTTHWNHCQFITVMQYDTVGQLVRIYSVK